MPQTKTDTGACNSTAVDRSVHSPTVELVLEARRGSRVAREELLLRSLPGLRKWACRRLPSRAHGHMDTSDLEQDVALLSIARLAHFTPEHAGSMPAYLRRVATNRVRDEHRRTVRRPQSVELGDDLPSALPNPLALAIQAEERSRYDAALWRLRAKDQRLIVARAKREWSLSTIARRFRFPSVAAARMALVRAERRLAQLLVSDRAVPQAA